MLTQEIGHDGSLHVERSVCQAMGFRPGDILEMSILDSGLQIVKQKQTKTRKSSSGELDQVAKIRQILRNMANKPFDEAVDLVQKDREERDLFIRRGHHGDSH